MAFSTVKVTIPDSSKWYINKPYNMDFGRTADQNGNIAKLKKIWNANSTSINKYGSMFGIPNQVIIGFIMSEGGGDKVQVLNPKGASTYDVWGLMAISPSAVYDSVVKWKVSSPSTPIPADGVKILNNKLPNLIGTSPTKAASPDMLSKIRNLLKTDDDFNIFAGCLVLRWLFERFTADGKAQLQKSLVAYNAGLYKSFLVDKASGVARKPDLTPKDTTALLADTRVPEESKSYLLKVFGKYGFMELTFKNVLA